MANNTRDALHTRLLSTLKRHAPHKVRVYTSDDDARDIAVPTRRRRWASVIEAIEARAWTKCEMLDKSGAVLGYFDNDEQATDVEDFADTKLTKTRSDVEWITSLMFRVHEKALASRDAETVTILRAQGDVVRELTSAMRELSGIYREQREAAEETAAMKATAEAGEGGTVKELLDAAPLVLQALPMLKQMLNGKSDKH